MNFASDGWKLADHFLQIPVGLNLTVDENLDIRFACFDLQHGKTFEFFFDDSQESRGNKELAVINRTEKVEQPPSEFITAFVESIENHENLAEVGLAQSEKSLPELPVTRCEVGTVISLIQLMYDVWN